MARVHHVKKARKAHKNAGIKKGQEYWWIQFRIGRGSIKRYFTKPPRPSQRTNSEYLSTLYGIQEAMEDAKPQTLEDLKSDLESWIGDLESLRDETQDKFDNMPDGLQQGDTGQLLEQRVSNLEDYISELQNIDIPDDIDDIPGATDEEALSDTIQRILDEIRNISCDAD